MTANGGSFRDQIKNYYQRGWSLVPVVRGHKKPPPQIPWKQYQAQRATPDELKQWFTGRDAYRDVAVIFGPVSGRLACRDFDTEDSYNNWADEYHEWARVLPTVKTVHGCHVYFRLPEDSPLDGKAVIKYKDGELRLSACICLLPPSHHPTGPQYEWIIPLPPGPITEIEPTEIGMEGELTVLKDDKGTIPRTIPSGQRNSTLARIAGILRRPGLSEDAIAAALHKENAERCDPPLPDDEVEAIAKSIARYDSNEEKRHYSAVRMDQVPREKVFWIWKPWIPQGKLVILEGDPKVGKTTLALQFAAILSQGWAFPGSDTRESEPRNTVILCAEDGLSDTLSHRLDQAGADCTRIWAMTSVMVQRGADKKDQMVTLADIDMIEQLVCDVKASLVVIDPIQSYIGSKINMDKANETRPVLQALASMGARRQCTPLILRHWRKSGGDPLKGGMGSIDFNAAARSIMLALRDPDDLKNKRVLTHTACNLAKEADSIGYSITEQDGFMWGLNDQRSADDLCREISHPQAMTTKSAKIWLESMLKERGAVSSNEIKSLARREGFTKYALDEAKVELQINVKKVGSGWFWEIPEN